MKNQFVAAVLAVGIMAASVAAAEKKWSDTAQFTLLSANGNTKASTLGASNLFKNSFGRWSLELPAGALTTKTDGQRTAEQYHAGEKLQAKVDDRNYVFEKFQWERDTFAGFAHRYDLSGGVGREWVKNAQHLFLSELGGGYINEQPVKTNERNTFGSGRAYAKYEYTLSQTAKFSQDAEYLHSFKDSADYRVNTETAVISSLSTHLSLKVGHTLKHRNKPPKDFGKNDTLTSVALIVNY